METGRERTKEMRMPNWGVCRVDGQNTELSAVVVGCLGWFDGALLYSLEHTV